jgi:ABC-2 type transport system ATP-binding protein
MIISLLQINGLTKCYSRKQTPAIDSVNFEVRNGEAVGFVGLNGAGKTTTISISVGVALPSSGTVIVDGHDIVREKAEASKTIGWVPEFPNYEPNAKAISLMKYFAGFYGMSKTATEEKSKELLAGLSLSGFEKRKFRTYSQGMKKRFSLALAMLPDPQNYLFDEILNGLDPEGIHYFRGLMVELKKQNKAVLLSSHILTEVENLADKVVFIRKGKVVKIATRDELTSYGGRVLKITIQNIDEGAIRSYLQSLGDVQVSGKTVMLSNFAEDPSVINSGLVAKRYLVGEFSLQKTSLEEYFFKLVADTR